MRARQFAFLFAAAMVLSACDAGSLVGKFKDLQQKGENHAARPVAEVVEYRCNFMDPIQRQFLRDRVNEELAGIGSAARATALDCDGDGAPDF